jgi:hypothetical protein
MLLMPALYNGFPLVFPDTDTYLKVAYGGQWTVDRSAFYGLFLRPILSLTGGFAGLWFAITVQAMIVAATSIAVIRRIAPQASVGSTLAIVAIASVTTSLAWHVSQFMPDAFTGALILLVWLAATRSSEEPGSLLLWLSAGFLTLIHYTHFGLFAVAAGVSLLFVGCTGITAREIFRRVCAASIVIAAVSCAHVAANGVAFSRWSVSPMGGWFLFARVNEDGLAEAWFRDHCGSDAPRQLCEISDSLPRDSQVLLWSTSSPIYPYFQQIASPVYWQWADMMSTAAIGSVMDHPAWFAKNSAIATARQFVSFEALDDQCPALCRVNTLVRHRPDVLLHSSRQLNGGLPKDFVRTVIVVGEALGLILLIPAFVIATRRRDREIQVLLATVVACLVANAAMAGALSDVQARYQSRIVWLAPFSILAVLARWHRPSRASQTSRPLDLGHHRA